MTVPINGPALPGEGALLFAYGTLQRGGQYHYFLEDCQAQFLGRGTLLTAYPLLLADYPCLLDLPGKGHRVEGETFRIPRSDNWIAVDRLEGHPDEYLRRLETIVLGATQVEAWTYFYIRDDLKYGALPAVSGFRIQQDP